MSDGEADVTYELRTASLMLMPENKSKRSMEWSIANWTTVSRMFSINHAIGVSMKPSSLRVQLWCNSAAESAMKNELGERSSAWERRANSISARGAGMEGAREIAGARGGLPSTGAGEDSLAAGTGAGGSA